MDELLRSWDGEEVIIRHDHPTGAWLVVAIHSTQLGPAGGGTRMRPYPNLADAVADAMRLAAGMTLKCAVGDLPLGGGKAVIAIPPSLTKEARGDLLRRYGTLVHQLGGLFLTGPDVGTSPVDMDVIAETGAPYIFGRGDAAGAAGGSAPPTALGVFAAIEAVCERVFETPSPRGTRVLVQGAGGVGSALIERLIEAGAEVLVSDVDPAVIERYRDRAGVSCIPPEAVPETPCDIYAPCALGGVLNADTIPRLHCRAVVGAANNQLATPEDAERLRERSICYVPDFVANLGGATAIIGIETMSWSQAQAEERVRGIKDITHEVLATAEAAGITTEAAARRLAQARLAGAEPIARARLVAA